MPVSFAVRDAQNYRADNAPQPAIYAQAEAIYKQLHPGQRPPGGVLAIMALSIAFENAQTSYKRGNEQAVVVPAFPADFWTTRFIAVVNPFEDGAAPSDRENLTEGWTATPNQRCPPLVFGEVDARSGRRGEYRQDGRRQAPESHSQSQAQSKERRRIFPSIY